MSNAILTGKPSIDKPWLKYYPSVLLDNLQVPPFTLRQYLEFNVPSPDTIAMHYYGVDIIWRDVFERADNCAKSLRVLGFGEGDQIPVFMRTVPEFIYMLLAAEKIGASLLCRDNTIEENVEAVAKSGANVIFAHDFLTQEDLDAYLKGTMVRKAVLLDPCNCCSRRDMPDYVRKSLDANYVGTSAYGSATMTWNEFMALGRNYQGTVDAPQDIHRPLFRCYTSGSTGPSKQVVHSAQTMLGNLVQMNFYGDAEVRPTWLHTILPTALVSVVIAMLLLPLSSNKLLILDPWVDVYDIDLELMRYKPNNWPMIPMFIEVLMNSDRIPADYDISHIVALGAGAEACNNIQLKRVNQFLLDHKSQIKFSTAYGSSETGSLTFHISGKPTGDCNVGCPMPLTTVSIFKPGTTEELTYGQIGEICVASPGLMLGYDNHEATNRALKQHPDGQTWMHTGDMGYMDDAGHLYTMGRGCAKRFGGGSLNILPMENMVADANIPGIVDHFFVNIPDPDHDGYLVPYLYVVLEEGYSVESIRPAVASALEPHMVPVQIVQVPQRPFWHFKTNRIGLTNEILEARRRFGRRA